MECCGDLKNQIEKKKEEKRNEMKKRKQGHGKVERLDIIVTMGIQFLQRRLILSDKNDGFFFKHRIVI